MLTILQHKTHKKVPRLHNICTPQNKKRSTHHIDGMTDWAQTTEEVGTFSVHVAVDR